MRPPNLSRISSWVAEAKAPRMGRKAQSARHQVKRGRTVSRSIFLHLALAGGDGVGGLSPVGCSGFRRRTTEFEAWASHAEPIGNGSSPPL